MIINLNTSSNTSSSTPGSPSFGLDGNMGQTVGFDSNNNPIAVDIGGTNMLLHSADISSDNWMIVQANGSITVKDGYNLPNNAISKIAVFENCIDENKISQSNIDFIKDETYTLSCYAKGNGVLQISVDSSSIVHSINSDQWKRYAFVVTTKTGDTHSSFGVSTAVNLEICGMKVEHGSIVTDWSPSPNESVGEDFDIISDNEIDSLWD